MTLLKGNCLKTLKTLPDCSVNSIVTDPPYELGFMGKSWDNSGIAYSKDLWAECLRVLKPGGHLLAFSGSRTYHRMVVAIEDSGFEIRDQIMWIYSSGFPKSHNLKDDWQGWGTALKPAHEPICVARKPLIGTVANNVLTYGTGAINIDGSRVGNKGGSADVSTGLRRKSQNVYNDTFGETTTTRPEGLGRWPANVIHDGSDEVLEAFPNEAARFFYCAKASRSERNAGLDDLETKQTVGGGGLTNVDDKYGSIKAPAKNFHPTVKPLALMRYLIKLVTPPNGTVLDPFLGSGTTAAAAILEGFDWIGCEMTEDYWPIIKARVEWAQNQQQPLFATKKRKFSDLETEVKCGHYGIDAGGTDYFGTSNPPQELDWGYAYCPKCGEKL